MGGRGSIGKTNHLVYDVDSMKQVLGRQGVKVYGLFKTQQVTGKDGKPKIDTDGRPVTTQVLRHRKKDLQVTLEVLDTVAQVQRTHGKLVDAVVITNKIKGDLSFHSNYEAITKSGKSVKTGRTLLINTSTIKATKKGLEKEIKQANRHYGKESKSSTPYVVSRNVREMTYHELGHAFHHKLKRTDLDAWNRFNNKINTLIKKRDTYNPTRGGRPVNATVSGYADTKKYKGSSVPYEHISEAMVHILRGTKPKKGADLIEEVRMGLSSVSSNKSRFNAEILTPKTLRKKRKKDSNGNLVVNSNGKQVYSVAKVGENPNKIVKPKKPKLTKKVKPKTKIKGTTTRNKSVKLKTQRVDKITTPRRKPKPMTVNPYRLMQKQKQKPKKDGKDK